ncbi:hypothetical protein [Paenibacillus planticolens]|uniref:Uncharacterized protein n=1 Tax=Paenibacillus planticolens TaxID=2654976 RepID=A0ABX1ZKI4_9BACL|nr:hypothetical protein [Paenibacillus planticolens]NOU99524.1 hypothetical protein [Paenibacillus planticolens]
MSTNIDQKKMLSFKSSINIQLDLGNTEIFKKYMPTPSHADAISSLLKGFLTREGSHSHMVIGPYGTGKSFLGNIVSSIVAKSLDDETFNSLLIKYESVDASIHQDLVQIKKLDKKYLPVVINGVKGKFRNTVIQSILRTLRNHGIQIILPNESGKILETIALWQERYPNTYRDFLEYLKKAEKSLNDWQEKIKTFNKREINWFRSIYPNLTSGSELIVEYEDNFVEQIQFILGALEQLDTGIFLVYDEFGRYLQTLGLANIHETMQDLQDLAELANASDVLHVLLITHRNLRQYSFIYEEEIKQELQRIEKRYRMAYIESDSVSFIRLAHWAMIEMGINSRADLPDVGTVLMGLKKYPMFPTLTDTEIENMVINGMRPIHPATLGLLPNLSNLLSQNERTLFTFLEDIEPFGLKKHIEYDSGWYYVDKLLDYFYHEHENYHDDIFEPIKLYKKVKQKISENETYLGLRIVKFITLWNLVSFQSKYPISDELLSWALGVSQEELSRVLELLTQRKSLRFNRNLGNWEINDGSSVDINRIIQDKEEILIQTKAEKLAIIKENISKRFYLARDYNDEKSITRFANVVPIWSSDLINDQSNLTSDYSSDAIIFYVLIEDERHRQSVIEIIKTSSSLNAIAGIPIFTTKMIEKSLKQFAIVNELLLDSEFISLDNRVNNELLLIKEDIIYQINQYLQQFTKFSNDIEWIINGTTVTIKSEMILEQWLSLLMEELYPKTPEIRNDSFNRKKLNNVQYRAAINVLNNILVNEKDDNIGIVGQGPDYLIYATTLKNNFIDLKNLDEIPTLELMELRVALIKQINDNKNGKLSDLTGILKKPPYGIREPVIPILLVALLRDHWDQLLFFANDMFVSNMDAEVIYEMMKNDEVYLYQYYEMSNEMGQFCKQLTNLFGDHESNYSERRLLRSDVLLVWLRSLPRITQISEKMSEDAIELKSIIRLSEVNPHKALDLLYCSYSSDGFSNLEKIKTEIESSFKNHANGIMEFIYSTTGFTSRDGLVEWAQTQHTSLKQSNKLIKALVQGNEESWIDDLTEQLVGVRRHEWSDTTHEMFLAHLKTEWEKLQSNIESDHLIQIHDGNDQIGSITKVELSHKSQVVLNNAKQLIKSAGRTIPQEELKYLVWKLLEEIAN